jgi:fucose 4-O-acetylase-like acetyltransferase
LLFRIIYSFHMPLFMFLAGAAGAYSRRPMNFDFIRRKFYMLVIPFVAWYLVGYGLNNTYHTIAFKTYIHHVIDSPDYGLWFLWVLFLNFAALMLIKWLSRWLKLFSYLVVWLAIYSIPTGKYGIGLVQWHLPFFLIGYLVFTYRHQLRRYRMYALLPCLVIFPFLALTWHRLYDPSYITSLQPRLIAHGLQSINLGDLANINVYPIMDRIYRYLVALSGIGFVYLILQLKPSIYLWRIFGFFGLYTLDIYVVHEYFFRYAIGRSWLEIISGFVVATGLSLALGILILRRINILSLIFLGGRSKPKALSLKK